LNYFADLIDRVTLSYGAIKVSEVDQAIITHYLT